jgi:heat shock protein HtpX
MARGRELFPADRGLQARMVLASVVTPLLVFAAVALVVLYAPTRIVVFVAIAAAVGVGMAISAYAQSRRAQPVSVAQAPEVHSITERLCAVASLPKPEIYVDHERQANSWVVARPLRPAELHLTDGLLELLEPHELEAVIGHELAHLANHDAMVMTVVGGPGAILLEGGAPLMRLGFWGVPPGLVAIAIGWVSRLGTNTLSRYRELSDDAGGAALTGRPSALASALAKVSGQIAWLPSQDLRAVAGRDAFHLLPVSERRGAPWWHKGAGATHPDVALRIERLEAMERRLQTARTPGPH